VVLPPPERPRPPPRLPRDVVLRERVLVERFAVLRGDLAAPVAALFVAERFAAGFRAVDERAAAPVEDFARVEDADRFDVDLRAPPLLLLRADEDADPPLLPVLAEPSKFHFPDITRCAASATASAMIEPSLVALETMLLAACDAVSAASRPASRIFLRAAGLAAIAAAAAVRPAASISLLIAALASLSIVSLDLERDDEDLESEPAELEPEERPVEELEREELLRVGFAIVYLPASLEKALYCRFGSLMNSAERRYVKGHRRVSQRCPSTWSAAGDVAVRQRSELTSTPFRPPC